MDRPDRPDQPVDLLQEEVDSITRTIMPLLDRAKTIENMILVGLDKDGHPYITSTYETLEAMTETLKRLAKLTPRRGGEVKGGLNEN